VFEPFFTTKDVGKGTGLGLSMIYGFVKQSGGHTKIYSEEGHGTSVKLYFPRSQEAQRDAAPYGDRESAPIGTETILVVEDDAGVRATAVVMLEGLGYRILEAEDGPAALALLEQHPDVDLVFTDVVMPGGMNGVELARQMRERNPGLRVLFTSGYPDKAFGRNGAVGEEVEFVSKPYEEKKLAQKIRQVLDG